MTPVQYKEFGLPAIMNILMNRMPTPVLFHVEHLIIEAIEKAMKAAKESQ